jgi:hypothetical protein
VQGSATADTVVETATGPSQTVGLLGGTVTSAASVSCPSNFPHAIGGGFNNLGNEGTFPAYDDPTESAAGAANGWQASLSVNNIGGTVQTQVYVICST